MAFIGTPLDSRTTFQSLQGKRFNGDGSETDFTLDVAPSSTLDIEVFVGNVRQDPNSAYTLSGTTLTFTGAPPSGTNNIYVVHQAKSVGTINAPANSITSDQLNTALLTGATDIGANIADADLFLVDDGAGGTLRKTAASRIKTYAGFSASTITGTTALDDVPATTDEFIISDGGTLKRIDANFVMNTPAFYAYKTANTTFANSTNVTLVPTSIVHNDGTAYDSSNGRFTIPSGQDGLYFFYAHFRINNFDPNRCSITFFVNGSETNWSLHEHAPEGDLSGRRPTIHGTAIKALSATDYIEAKGLQISGSSDTVTNLGFGGFKIR
jgi:hypothetical protein